MEHLRIDAVLIKKIDRVDFEPPQGSVGHLADALRPAIQSHETRRQVRLELEPEFRGDRHLAPVGRECLPHEFLVRERAVYFSSIEERDTPFDSSPDHGSHLVLVFGWTVPESHSHAAEPDSRDFQAAGSKFAFLHDLSSELVPNLQLRLAGPSQVSRSFRFVCLFLLRC